MAQDVISEAELGRLPQRTFRGQESDMFCRAPEIHEMFDKLGHIYRR